MNHMDQIIYGISQLIKSISHMTGLSPGLVVIGIVIFIVFSIIANRNLYKNATPKQRRDWMRSGAANKAWQDQIKRQRRHSR